MMFDVMVKAGKNTVGKDIFNVYRVHDSTLSSYLRNVQDVGYYIVAVIPLFRKKEQIIDRDDENRILDISETYYRKDIDPRLLRTVDSIGE